LSDGAAETLAVVAAGTGNRLRITVAPDQDGAAAFRIAAATDWRGQQPVALSSNINATAIAAGDWHYIDVSLRTATAPASSHDGDGRSDFIVYRGGE